MTDLPLNRFGEPIIPADYAFAPDEELDFHQGEEQ